VTVSFFTFVTAAKVRYGYIPRGLYVVRLRLIRPGALWENAKVHVFFAFRGATIIDEEISCAAWDLACYFAYRSQKEAAVA
jgi:hypothetical protein